MLDSRPGAGTAGAAGYRSIRAPEIGAPSCRGAWAPPAAASCWGHDGHSRGGALDNGGYGYSYIAGRDKAHAELCALADALLQQPEHGERLQQQLIARWRAAARTAPAARPGDRRQPGGFLYAGARIKP